MKEKERQFYQRFRRNFTKKNIQRKKNWALSLLTAYVFGKMVCAYHSCYGH